MHRQLHFKLKPGRQEKGQIGSALSQHGDCIDGGVSGLAVHPVPNRENAYYYLPLIVVPRQQSDGQPMLSLQPIEEGGFLRFIAMWRASDEQLVALRGYLASHLELDQPDLLELVFAPVNRVNLKLFLNQGENGTLLLGFSSSNGSPPYSSLFDLKLDKHQFEQVTAMIGGQPGIVSIQLDSSWTEMAQISGQLKGTLDLDDCSDASMTDATALRRFLLNEIEAGNLELQINTALAVDSEEYKLLLEGIIAQAVDALQAMHIESELYQRVINFEVEYLDHIPVERPVSIITDLADWFEAPG